MARTLLTRGCAMLVLFIGAAVGLDAATVAAAQKTSARVRLDDLGRRYGLRAHWAEPGRELRLRSRWTTLDFEAGSREAAWNGLRLFLGESVVAAPGSLQLARTDWLAIVRPLLDPAAVSPPDIPDLVVIDPGHGGDDPGSENRAARLTEKNLTLDLARRLRRELKQRGFRVALTRDGDKRLRARQLADLEQRARVANRLGADVFVSLHFNSLPADRSVAGVETYMLTPAGQRSTASFRRTAGDGDKFPGNRHDHWNAVLGAAVHERLVADLDATDRGLKRARFAVLRAVECPAILVEAGFLTSPAEARKLDTAAYRQDIAEAIGAGIDRYRDRVLAVAKGQVASR